LDQAGTVLPLGRAGHKGLEALTLLEVVVQLHGDFRRGLEVIRVIPLQAGVFLFLRRDADARVMDAATALRVRSPTVSGVVKDLVRKWWVTKHRSVTDTRVVNLRLSRWGQVLARKLEAQVDECVRGSGEQDSDRRWPEAVYRVPAKTKEASS
jgi:DNA-binding MarR family transcriptional regulator